MVHSCELYPSKDILIRADEFTHHTKSYAIARVLTLSQPALSNTKSRSTVIFRACSAGAVPFRSPIQSDRF